MKSHQSYRTRTFDEGALFDGAFADGCILRNARGRFALIGKQKPILAKGKV